MTNCKLDMGFFSGEFSAELVRLAGFKTYQSEGEFTADGTTHHFGDDAPKRIARAISNGFEGAAVLLAAIRYAEEERTGHNTVQTAIEQRRAAEVERAAAADKLRTAQIQSAMQKRALGEK